MHVHKENLSELLLGFRRKIMEKANSHALKEDLTFSQFEVLWFVGFHGKQSMESLAAFLRITPPSATSMIGKMEKRGFVKRVHDVRDRRVIYVSLTAKSKKQLSSICKQKEQLFKKLLAKLSSRDRKQLERIIRILITD